MKELVTYLAQNLVSKPEEIEIIENNGDKTVNFELKIADEDLNYLIGKQGRTVKAMRSLLAASAAKAADGRRYFLKLSSNSIENKDKPEAGEAIKVPPQGL